jgi:tetratricopeptide (TPR) repeat protein
MGYENNDQYALIPLVADFLRRKCPSNIGELGRRLIDRAYTTIKAGGEKHDAFQILETQWRSISAALPIILEVKDDERIQTTCDALLSFLSTSGRWDERIVLAEQAEASARAAGNLSVAGWRAFQAGHSYSARGEASNVLSCATRAAEHWARAPDVGPRERGLAKYLTGIGCLILEDYDAAMKSFDRAIGLFRIVREEKDRQAVARAMNALANTERLAGYLNESKHHSRVALRFSRMIGFSEGIANATGNLAASAIDERAWPSAELFARTGIELSEKLVVSGKQGHQRWIASNCVWLARALLEQKRHDWEKETTPLIERAEKIFASLRTPDLNKAYAAFVEYKQRYTSLTAT